MNTVDEAWAQLSEQIGGKFYPSDSIFTPIKVEKQHLIWTVQLDIARKGGMLQGATSKIRLRVPYIALDEFSFKIYPKTIYSPIAKLLGKQDISIGFPDIDNESIIQGNDERKVKKLLESTEIRAILSSQSEYRLDVSQINARHAERPTVQLLQYEGVRDTKNIINIHHLSRLFDLFAIMLDYLKDIGSADDTNRAPTLDKY